MYMKNRFEGNRYVYAFLKTCWGLYVSFEAEVNSFEKYEEKDKCLKITDELYFRIIDGYIKYKYKTVFGPRMNVAEEYIASGIKMVSEQIVEKSPCKNDTLIVFKEFEIAHCDYQDEALTDAVIKWAELAFSFQGPQVKIEFNKKKNRYEFDFNNAGKR